MADLVNADFAHLHVHYGYSSKDGCQKVASAVMQARRMGFRALACTDHGTIGGWIKFVAECSRKKEKGGKAIDLPPIKPMLGCEFYLARRHDLHDKENQPEGKKGNRHLLVVAKDWEGYQNLCRLIQRSYTHGFYHSPRVDIGMLAQHSKGLMCSTACLSSVVNACLLNGKYAEAKKAATLLRDVFGKDFFLEVMYHGLDEEAAIIPDILKLGAELNTPVVATNDCFVAGTMVSTDRGVVPIEEVRAGDRVLTHLNRYRSVEFVNRRDVQETVVVRCSVGTTAFECTPEHPVFVSQRTRRGFTAPVWKVAGQLTPDDYLLVHATPASPRSVEVLSEIDLRAVIGPGFDHLIEGQEYVTRQGFGGRPGEVRVPLRLPVTDDLLFVLGRYVAEGSSDRNGSAVTFSAHRREVSEQDRVERYFAQFGSTSYRPENGNDGKLVFSSVIWNAALASLCGTGASGKHLPTLPGGSYLDWSSSQIMSILAAYVGGDGHIPRTCEVPGVVAATTSKRLCFEIADVLRRAGVAVFPTVRTRFAKHINPKADSSKWSPLWVLSLSPADFPAVSGLFCGLAMPDCSSRTAVRRRKAIRLGDHMYVKVRSVEKSASTTSVFNLQVAEDETFVANGFVVHNCHYTTKDMAESQEALIAMKFSKCMADPSRMRFPHPEFYMKSAAEMGQIFGHRPELLTNTVAFAERIDDKSIERNMGGMRLPKFPVPPGFKDQHAYLTHLAWDGMKRLGWENSPKHIERLNLELADVKVALKNNGYDFPSYFLIDWDINNQAREMGIWTGSGRGSGYGSVLLRALRITYGPDPIEHGLFWERFLGFDNRRFYHPSHFGLREVEETPTVELSDLVDAVEEKKEEEEAARAIEAELDEARDVSADPGGVDRY